MPRKGTSRNVYTYRKREHPNLQQRRHKWYAVMAVPRNLQASIGKTRLVKTLETGDIKEAKRRLPVVLANWHSQIAEALPTNPEDRRAAWYRRALAEARTEQQRQQILFEIQEEADDVAYKNMDWDRHQSPGQVPEAQQFYRQATGTAPARLDSHVSGWLASIGVKQKTEDLYKKAVEAFAGKHPTVPDFTAANVQSYLSSLQVSAATKQRDKTALRSFWRYLRRPDVAALPRDFDPFADVELPRRRKAVETSYLPFPAAAIGKLYTAAEGDETLRILIRLAAFTGARIEELAALRTIHVHEDHIEIADAKTEAGHRLVPLDPRVRKMVKRLAGQSSDGYLLKLTANKYGDRSNAAGKRFGRLKTRLGWGERHVFHSIRKTFITALEHAGVPEPTVQDIVGHERDTLTGSVYSGKSTMAMRLTAVAKLTYPGLS